MKILIFILSLTLTGCSFHLRGSSPSTGLYSRSVHLMPEHPYDPIQQTMRQQLLDQHFNLEASNASTLTIVSERFNTQTLAYGANGQIRRERLRYTLTFKLQDAEGTLLIPETDIHAERDRLVNQDQILGDYNEEELLKEDMRRECVDEMTRYFSG